MTIGAVGYLVLLVFQPAAIGLADTEWLPSSGRTMARPLLLIAIASIVGISVREALRGRLLVAATGVGALMALCGHGLILLGDHIRNLSCFPIFHPTCNTTDVFPRTGNIVMLSAILDLAVIGTSLTMIVHRDTRVAAPRCLRLAWIPAALLLGLSITAASPTPRWGLLAVVTPGALIAIGALLRRTARATAIAAGWAAAFLMLPMIDSIVGELRAIGGSPGRRSLASQVISLRPASAVVAAVIILVAALAMVVRSESRSEAVTSHSLTAPGGEAPQSS